MLIEPWKPDENFLFPVLGERKLKFQHQWLKRFPWLAYTSIGNQGALCKYCVIFHHETGGKGNHQKLKNLVTQPFNRWKDAIETFINHSKCHYHLSNQLYADNFVTTLSKSTNIALQLDSVRAEQIERNRKKLKSIIDTIIFCGRQELPLRGSSDSGDLQNGGFEPVVNDGNFRALLRMRISCGDTNLKEHVENGPLNAKYLSPEIQNNIIKICGNIIQDDLVKKINDSKCFAVLVDSTTDISVTEQVSLCVRYVTQGENFSFSLREDFLEFFSIKTATGRNLGNNILNALSSLGVNCSNLCGQGYDGASSMSGCFNGVQAVIKETNPAALYVHCSSHSLNLALMHASNIPAIRNCLGTVKSVIKFLKNSAKRMDIFREKIKEHLPNVQWNTLKSMCETRWVENHEALIRFAESYIAVFETLEELETDSDSNVSSTASQLSKSMTGSSFIISLVTASHLFTYTLTLCKNLQDPNCDLGEALDLVANIVDAINVMRKEMDSEFRKIFIKANSLLNLIGESIKMPRVALRQKHRSNCNSSDPEEYFRTSIAVPFIDDFLSQMKLRFNDHKSTISSLHKLIPSICASSNFAEDDFKVYAHFLDFTTLSSELNLWKNKWQDKEGPSSALEALTFCRQSSYPNVHVLLKILATLPVTTCTPERTFSSLRRLKTYLRNSTGEERLTGLALMSIHRDVPIITEEVINRFAAEKTRRLEFVI